MMILYHYIIDHWYSFSMYQIFRN